jgi:trehalose 6-phosphate synthase
MRVALYLIADVLMATPLRQGASLPALEFVALGRPGSALILSEFTGTAAMLREAYLVNPYDDEQLRAVVKAVLATDDAERSRRMQSMHEYVAAYDNQAWARSFLNALDDTRIAAAASDKRGPWPHWPYHNQPVTKDSPRWQGMITGGGAG